MKALIAPVVKIGEAIAVWLNPERKEKVILRNAIASAVEIIKILDRVDEYKDMPEAKRMKMRIHFEKQLNAWRDGTP